MGTTGIWGGGGLGGGECGAVTGVEFHDGYCCANGEVECCSCGRGCCCVYGAAVIGRGSCGFRGGGAVLVPGRGGWGFWGGCGWSGHGESREWECVRGVCLSGGEDRGWGYRGVVCV